MKNYSEGTYKGKYSKLNAEYSRLERRYLKLKIALLDIYGGKGFGECHWVADEEIPRIVSDILRGIHSLPNESPSKTRGKLDA